MMMQPTDVKNRAEQLAPAVRDKAGNAASRAGMSARGLAEVIATIAHLETQSNPEFRGELGARGILALNRARALGAAKALEIVYADSYLPNVDFSLRVGMARFVKAHEQALSQGYPLKCPIPRCVTVDDWFNSYADLLIWKFGVVVKNQQQFDYIKAYRAVWPSMPWNKTAPAPNPVPVPDEEYEPPPAEGNLLIPWIGLTAGALGLYWYFTR